MQDRLVFLENYDIGMARSLTQGVDVWLNTPRRPQEASGTSGMKAAINGVINCSILDGWWAEGYNGENGWAIEGNDYYTEDRGPATTTSRSSSSTSLRTTSSRASTSVPAATCRSAGSSA